MCISYRTIRTWATHALLLLLLSNFRGCFYRAIFPLPADSAEQKLNKAISNAKVSQEGLTKLAQNLGVSITNNSTPQTTSLEDSIVNALTQDQLNNALLFIKLLSEKLDERKTNQLKALWGKISRGGRKVADNKAYDILEGVIEQAAKGWKLHLQEFIHEKLATEYLRDQVLIKLLNSLDAISDTATDSDIPQKLLALAKEIAPTSLTKELENASQALNESWLQWSVNTVSGLLGVDQQAQDAYLSQKYTDQPELKKFICHDNDEPRKVLFEELLYHIHTNGNTNTESAFVKVLIRYATQEKGGAAELVSQLKEHYKFPAKGSIRGYCISGAHKGLSDSEKEFLKKNTGSDIIAEFLDKVHQEYKELQKNDPRKEEDSSWSGVFSNFGNWLFGGSTR